MRGDGTNGASILRDPMLERAFAAALVNEPRYFELAGDDFGVDRICDPHAKATITAVANLRARLADVTRETVAAELERDGYADLDSWFPQLFRVSVIPPPVTVLGWMSTVVRHAAAREAAIVDADQPARIEVEIDELALADAEPRCHAPLAIDVALLDTPPIRSYPTGNAELDALIGGGVSTRQLLTVLGPPGAGKSAWAIATAIHIAPTLPVLIASTELEQHELMARIAGNIADLWWSGIARGAVPRQRILDALAGIRIRLLGCDALPREGSRALEMIEREATTISKLYETPPLVIVDYLQDLARGSDRDLRSRIGDLATDVRSMSQRLDCPAIAVSSVARAFYNPRRAQEMREADDPAIYLAAAKESGDVDYASAVVIFLDVEDDRDKPERSARIAVAKSRHGRVGFAGARFAGASGRWIHAPDAVSAMSAPGRAEQMADGKLDDADKAVLAAVTRLHLAGDRALCTKSQLRLGCGIATGRVPAALDRLLHVRKLRLVTIEREEGGKNKKREIYEPVDLQAPVAEPPPRPLELDLDEGRGGLHGGMP